MEASFSVPSTSLDVRVKRFPLSNFAFPFKKSPSLISGPLVSSNMAIGRFNSSRSFLTSLIVSRCDSLVPWEKLILAVFMPFNISLRKTSSFFVDGPNVHMIFVFLIVCFIPPFHKIIIHQFPAKKLADKLLVAISALRYIF